MSRYADLTPAQLLAEWSRLLEALGRTPRPGTYTPGWFHIPTGYPNRKASRRRHELEAELLMLADQLAEQEAQAQRQEQEAQEAAYWAARDVPTGARYALDNFYWS